MKYNYFFFAPKIIFISCLMTFNVVFPQMQIKAFYSLPIDVNDSGFAVSQDQNFNFLTSSQNDNYFLGSNLIFGVNNYNVYLGQLPIVIDGQTLTQPAYKKNGYWHGMGFPPASNPAATYTLSQISENSNYITGQISSGCCDSQAFLYDTTTDTYQIIPAPTNGHSFGKSINNAGIIGGWYQAQSTGSITPAFMSSGPTITPVTGTLSGQINAINASNVMVGGNQFPFIYDATNNSFTQFTIPSEYQSGVFTSISDNGTAVGYYQKTLTVGVEYHAIIYNPALSNQPLLLEDVINSNGLTYNGLGVAMAISPDGNYIVGAKHPGSLGNYSGWVLKLNGMLYSTCFIHCPDNIHSLNPTGINIINYSTSYSCNQHPNASIIMVSGLTSGSDFPIGNTHVVHNLVDPSGLVLDSCDFWVTVDEHYCSPLMNTTESITQVTIGGINNVSDANSTVAYENFTNVTGYLFPDNLTNLITLKGFTGGNHTDYFTVFFDWNHDGNFDNSGERYDIGSITNSTGVDGIEVSGNITVPNGIYNLITMRVVKTRENYAVNGCPASGYGQIEDYKLGGITLDTNTLDKTTIKFFPNPASDVLNISSDTSIDAIYIYNMIGQEVLQTKPHAMSVQLDLAALKAGTYLVKSTSGDELKTFKLVKQ